MLIDSISVKYLLRISSLTVQKDDPPKWIHRDDSPEDDSAAVTIQKGISDNESETAD